PPATPPVVVEQAPPPTPPGRWRNWRVALIAAVGVLAVAGVAVLLYVNLRPTPRPHAAITATTATTAPAQTVATAVPVPSLGQPIAVGQTPNFVVASRSGRQLYVANTSTGVVTVV